MNCTIRWLLLLPTLAFSTFASWMLYPLGHALALLACQPSLRDTESTTDFSRPDYSVTAATCAADWFPVVDAWLMALAILLCIALAGFVGYRLPPSHRRLSSALACLLVAGGVSTALLRGT